LRTDAGTGTGGLADEEVSSGRMRRSERVKEKRTPSSGVRGDGGGTDSSGSGLVDFEILARHHINVVFVFTAVAIAGIGMVARHESTSLCTHIVLSEPKSQQTSELRI